MLVETYRFFVLESDQGGTATPGVDMFGSLPASDGAQEIMWIV